MKKILIVGNGGREHALLWKLKKDRPEAEFFITLGNGGTSALAESVNISPTDNAAVTGFAESESIDLVVVGPEAPLAAGLVDELDSRGIVSFGPSAAAARIESSKAYAKKLMREAGVPTADFQVFDNAAEALSYIDKGPENIVVKADGLAAGKGAVVCSSRKEAREAVSQMMQDRQFGEAGSRVVIEEFMTGEELSVFALVDGKNFVILAPSQDHKAVGEGDTGPNTGGMGSYSPVSIATPELLSRVESEIIGPTVEAMARDGSTYKGCLYAGLMLTPTGPRVVEYNCRFGDPETQVVLPLLESDLAELMLACARGELAGVKVKNSTQAAVCVVLASGGYPGSYGKGREMTIAGTALDNSDQVLFHAGTAVKEGKIVTSGGRVAGAVGIAGKVREAARKAYELVEAVSFEGMYFRRDIAHREINRK